LQVIEDTPASRKGKGGGGGRKRRDDGEIRSSDESGGEGGAPGASGHKEGGKKRSSKKAGGRVGMTCFCFTLQFREKCEISLKIGELLWMRIILPKCQHFCAINSIFLKNRKNCLFSDSFLRIINWRHKAKELAKTL
jgi:hypothetical protein